MYISVLQMFKIGVGPSSSHTLGPMKAAKDFLVKAQIKGVDLSKVKQMKTDLYGSLALTGRGHHTDKAVIMGMMGEDPVTVDTTTIYSEIEKLQVKKKVKLLKSYNSEFRINFLRSQKLPYHTNGLKFTLLDNNDNDIYNEIYYSIGGGFILSEEETQKQNNDEGKKYNSLPFPFKNAKELFWLSESNDISVPRLILENEKKYHNTTEKEILKYLDDIWRVMNNCISRGLITEGTLPGPLNLKRRAPGLYQNLLKDSISNPMYYLNWINTHAIAVSEENASGGQVVTSPTNGSAGVIPATINYYNNFCADKHPNKLYDFLLSAGAVGGIFKLNSTISGAEGGCQAEIGVSASMAAGGLTCALDGSSSQIEKASEIAMEHFIGMTCDPIGGLVQIPCIERNGVGAVKAINASALALTDNSQQRISLDRIVRVMKKTGEDMKTKYKETSKGGLAQEYNRKYIAKRFANEYDDENKANNDNDNDNDNDENNEGKDKDSIKLYLPETLC